MPNTQCLIIFLIDKYCFVLLPFKMVIFSLIIMTANNKEKKAANKKLSNKPHKTYYKKKSLFENPIFLIIFILLLTFITFIPSLRNGFISSWDDAQYILDNLIIRQLNFLSIKAMFVNQVNISYVPLPLLSFAIEYQFFGFAPIPFHITNLILHLGCTFLVFYFLRLLKLEDIYAALGAFLFGIHPMHVESVAWITERKDLLYSLFYLTSMIFYILNIQRNERSWKLISLSILFFILALFSKIQAVSLPLSLLLIDYYFQRPLKLKLIIEKIPLFFLSFIIGMVGILIINKQIGFQINQSSPFYQRIFLGLYALSAYLLKFLAPFYLSAIYPIPFSSNQTLPLIYYLSPLFLLLVGFGVYKSAKYTKAIIFGFLFFLFNIIFLLQFIGQGVTYLADRYSYISYIGLSFILAWTVERSVKKSYKYKPHLVFSMFILCTIFIFLTYNRCQVWEGVQLWSDVIKKYPEYSTGYNNRGLEYQKLGQTDRAIDDFTKTLEIDPNNYKAYANRAIIYGDMGQWDRQVTDCSKSIEINPKNQTTYSNRGLAYEKLGDWENAIKDYTKVLEFNPNAKEAYLNRGGGVCKPSSMG